MKIHKEDQVLVISGKDRGRKGKVLDVFPKKEKATVEKLNLKKKHVKPKKAGEKGQLIEISAGIHISDLKLICPKCGKAVRVSYKIEGKKKYRICKKCKKEI